MRKKFAYGFIEIIVTLLVLGAIVYFALPFFMGGDSFKLDIARNIQFGAQKGRVISTLNSAIKNAAIEDRSKPSATTNNSQLAGLLGKSIHIVKRKRADDGWIILYTSDGFRIDVPSWSYNCKKSHTDNRGTNCIVYVDLNTDSPPSDYLSYDTETYRKGGMSDIFPVIIYDSEAKGIYTPSQIYRAIMEGDI